MHRKGLANDSDFSNERKCTESFRFPILEDLKFRKRYQ